MNYKEENLNGNYERLAVIYGYLQKAMGKVTLSSANKVLNELGFDRMTRKDYVFSQKVINEKENLKDIITNTIDGVISLDDLKNAKGNTPKNSLDNNLDDVLTPYMKTHQRSLDNSREYKQLTREEARYQNRLDDVYSKLSQDIKENDITVDLPPIVKTKKEEKALIITGSDYHVGNSYKIKGNTYNFEILKKRVRSYTESAINYGESLGITHVYFIHLGDLIEGINMRATNQAYFDEFTYSEQVSNGIKLLVWQIKELTKHFKVTLGLVQGNHDRTDGNKNSAVYGDGAMRLVLEQLLLFKENNVFNNLEILDNRDDIYNLEFDVLGKHIMCTHGETIKRNATDNIAKHMRNQKIDLLLGGHYHSFLSKEENNASMVAISGSMKGYDMYSKTLNMGDSVASQLMVVLDKNSIELKTVFL